MGKMNLAGISAGLNSVKAITDNLQSLSHFELVPADLIRPAEDNPYASEDTEQSRQELAQSIQQNGLLHPLVLNKISEDEYRLISGERRYRAITEFLRWPKIPAMVFEHLSMNDAKMKLHAANLDVRSYSAAQKLRFYEEAHRLMSSMKESGEYTGSVQKGIAELLGVSDRQVRKYQTLVQKAPEGLAEDIREGKKGINEAVREIRSRKKQTDASAHGTVERSESRKQKEEPVPVLQPVPKSGTGSESESAEHSERHAVYTNKIYFVQPEGNVFAVCFKAYGDTMRLGALSQDYPTESMAWDALRKYAEEHGLHQVILPEKEGDE